MDFEELNTYCLSKNGAYLDFPFDQTTAVYKIADKMFCLTDLEYLPLSMSLKSDPELSVELIEQYDFIKSGYHLNKKHWITVDIESYDNDKLYKELIDNSYKLVYSKLTKKKQQEIGEK